MELFWENDDGTIERWLCRMDHIEGLVDTEAMLVDSWRSHMARHRDNAQYWVEVEKEDA